jgi:hypothetical protein
MAAENGVRALEMRPGSSTSATFDEPARSHAASLLCGRSEHRRYIPEAVVDGFGVVRFARAIDTVRFQSCAKKAFIRHAA